MCDACTPTFNRRALLRGVAVGGVAVAAGSLWRPTGADAATPGSGMEFDAMGEDVTAMFAGSTAAAGTAARTEAATQNATPAVAAAVAPAGTTRTIPAPNTGGVKPPPILSRALWRADESIRLDNRAYAPIRKLIVHHTASPNKPSNPAAVVREVEAFHASGRGFSDTGYNFMIDHKGVIYEGRAARRYRADEAVTGEDGNGWGVVGAHAKGVNTGSCGICLIGNFEEGSPTDAAVSSLVWLLAWEASRHRIDAKASDDYWDIYGSRTNFPNISGHRQVGQTVCPGKRLYNLLPTIRDEVARRAGAWDPLVVDNLGVLRLESGALRDAAASISTGTTTPASGGTTPATIGTPGTGSKLTGIRVTSNSGTIFTAGKARSLGNPAKNGLSKVVGLANSAVGDGYWALGADGSVAAFGMPHLGDAAGKGAAADIAATTTGAGYWILMSDGGIYPFGDAKYSSSPKKAGLGGTSLRIAARPQGDGYWIVQGDGSVRSFGSAPKFTVPGDAGKAVDVAPTPTGAGLWVLTDAGRVAPLGDAVDKGDLKRSKVKWRKPVAHVVGMPSGQGYVIVSTEGSMLPFGDAPSYPSFGGSGITATGVALAFT